MAIINKTNYFFKNFSKIDKLGRTDQGMKKSQIYIINDGKRNIVIARVEFMKIFFKIFRNNYKPTYLKA